MYCTFYTTLKIIRDIVNIRFGVSNRPEYNGDVAIIQGKDFSNEGRFIGESIAFTISEGLKSRDYLQPGEILFSAKGNRRYAAYWNKDTEPAVASLTFFVLTVVEPNLLPEYLTLYLNQNMAQKYFAEHERGTSIPIISRGVLDNLTVPIPSLEIQQKVVRLHELWLQEKNLMEELSHKKKQLIELSIQTIIKSSI